MRLDKIGLLNDKYEVVGQITIDVMSILVNNERIGPCTDVIIFFTLEKGMHANPLPFSIPISDSVMAGQQSEPTSLINGEKFVRVESSYFIGVYIFKNQVFRAEVEQVNDEFEEKIVLLIKKYVYAEESKWRKLKEEVALMEKVINYDSEIKRTAIPEAVKLFVYTRDGGKCVRCGSTRKIHFDHIIPVSKGGNNGEQNIQILCEHCNLKKSDNISF